MATFPYGFSVGAVALPPPGIFQMDPALQQPGANDWADLARANSNAFLDTLLIALHAPNPISTAGPTVEEAFKSHLVSLAPNQQQTQLIPSLYSILKTFWLPSSPAYFSLTASTSTARIPSEHRFLYWDPQPLVFNGISCPNCSSTLVNNGRISSGPIKIYDIGKPFFIIGCEYVCRSNTCVNATTSEGRKFASIDPAILRSLPAKLKDEFPAKLLHGEGYVGSGLTVWNWRALGVSTSLWNLVMGALRSGLRKDVILGLIWTVQNGVPDYPPSDSAQQQQPQHVLSQVAQQSQMQDGHEADDRMDEDDDDVEDEDEDEEECARTLRNGKNGNETTQTVSSTVSFLNLAAIQKRIHNIQCITDAYGAAWNENTATTGAPSQKQAPDVAPQGSPSSQPNINQPTSTVQPAAPPQPSYKPFPSYPFAPFAYLPHHMINAIHGSAPIPTTSPSTTPNEGPTSASAGPGSSTISGGSKRSPRHCSKCGSQECKGKGGRSFCANACQDCGKLECKGRNSRRPDKKCAEGWQ